MKGSEKQIEWAEGIKAKRLGEIEEAYQTAIKSEEYQNDEKFQTRIESGYATAKAWFEEKEDARYFIDTRNLGTFHILSDREVADFGREKGYKSVGKGIIVLGRALGDSMNYNAGYHHF